MKKTNSNLTTRIRKYLSSLVEPFTRKERTPWVHCPKESELPRTLQVIQCIVFGAFATSLLTLFYYLVAPYNSLGNILIPICTPVLLITLPPCIIGVARMIIEDVRNEVSLKGRRNQLFNAVRDWLDTEPLGDSSSEYYKQFWKSLECTPNSDEDWNAFLCTTIDAVGASKYNYNTFDRNDKGKKVQKLLTKVINLTPDFLTEA